MCEHKTARILTFMFFRNGSDLTSLIGPATDDEALVEAVKDVIEKAAMGPATAFLIQSVEICPLCAHTTKTVQVSGVFGEWLKQFGAQAEEAIAYALLQASSAKSEGVEVVTARMPRTLPVRPIYFAADYGVVA